MAENQRLNSLELETTVLDLPSGSSLRLRGISGKAIEESEWLDLRGGPFASEGEARRAALHAKTAMVYWSVLAQIPLDFGIDRTIGVVFGPGRELVRQQHHIPAEVSIRGSVHGVDVFPSPPDPVFVSANATIRAGQSFEAFLSAFRRGHNISIPNPKLDLACDLFRDSLFDKEPKSQFVTLISAIEALIDRSPRRLEAQRAIDAAAAAIRASALPGDEQTSLLTGLNEMRSESITRAGRKLVKDVVGQSEYGGMAAERFFGYCYGIRSGLVHKGTTDSDVDLPAIGVELRRLVSDVLLHRLEGTRTP